MFKKVLFISLIITILFSCESLKRDENFISYKIFEYKATAKVIETESDFNKLYISLPIDYPGRQELISVKYSQEPFRIHDNGVERIAIFNVDRKEKKTIKIKCKIKVYDIDFNTFMDGKIRDDKVNGREIRKYVRPSQFVESDNVELIELSNSLIDASQSVTNNARSLFDYSRTAFEYVLHDEDMGALYAYKNKTGDCTEYSSLYAALCRVQKIPNRLVAGVSLNYAEETGYHQLNEVYFKDYGWIPMDPTWADGSSPYSFENMENYFVFLSLDSYEGITGSYGNLIYYETGKEMPIYDFNHKLRVLRNIN